MDDVKMKEKRNSKENTNDSERSCSGHKPSHPLLPPYFYFLSFLSKLMSVNARFDSTCFSRVGCIKVWQWSRNKLGFGRDRIPADKFSPLS